MFDALGRGEFNNKICLDLGLDCCSRLIPYVKLTKLNRLFRRSARDISAAEVRAE